MSIPLWVLLGFAGWTILILLSTIAIYRWRLILTGRANLYDFPADVPHGQDWYRRAMRAHANCLENLPIYTAIVVPIALYHIDSGVLNALAIIILIARIFQSLTHILFAFTNLTVGVRFVFFATQLVAMIWMGIYECLVFLT